MVVGLCFSCASEFRVRFHAKAQRTQRTLRIPLRIFAWNFLFRRACYWYFARRRRPAMKIKTILTVMLLVLCAAAFRNVQAQSPPDPADEANLDTQLYLIVGT